MTRRKLTERRMRRKMLRCAYRWHRSSCLAQKPSGKSEGLVEWISPHQPHKNWQPLHRPSPAVTFKCLPSALHHVLWTSGPERRARNSGVGVILAELCLFTSTANAPRRRGMSHVWAGSGSSLGQTRPVVEPKASIVAMSCKTVLKTSRFSGL